MLDKEITIELNNVPLEEVLSIKFAYVIDHLSLKENASVKAEKQALGAILNEVLTVEYPV